jgi:nucleolar protein 56
MIMFTTWFGSFLYDNEEVAGSKLFPKDAKEIAARMSVVAQQKVLDEERQLCQGLSRFLILDERLTSLGGELIEEEMPDISFTDFGYSKDLLHDAMMILAEEKTKEPSTKDENITQAVNALDDLIQSSNLLSERLHEWYGIHFPKQLRMMKDEEFIEVVISSGGNAETANSSDLEPIMDLARTLGGLNERRTQLEDYIKIEMEDNLKNISYLVGPIIGARLVSKAGGLKRLARLPSGTIQVLGAEKALFRHLKEGSKPPKHGLIFQHPLVHRAPYWQRGKIARAFASKIAVAARLDEHSDKAIGEELKNGLFERIEEIKKKYPNPPKKSYKKSNKKSNNRSNKKSTKKRRKKSR